MLTHLVLVVAALSVMSVPALAAPCKDAQGRFAKCPKPIGGPIKCKNEKGKYAKCGMPGTHTVDR